MKIRLNYSDAARQQLTENCEGCELKAYPDPGTHGAPWTIGYGHTGPDVKPGMTCTQKQADHWLMWDIQKAVAAVNNYIQPQLTQHQFDACVDFSFNAGIEAFHSSTLCRLLNAGKFDLADDEFAKWINGGGHVMPGLIRRRAAETKWFNTKD